MEPTEEHPLNRLARVAAELQAQVTALTSVVQCLIQTHPDRAAVDASLERLHHRLDAITNASPLPDHYSNQVLSLIQEMREVARRAPKG